MEDHIEDMHKCQVCKSLYKDVYELNRHSEKEHKPTIYECNLCEFVTRVETECNRHMSDHEKNMATCEVCGKKEKNQTEMDQHIQSKHVKEMFNHFVKRNERRPSPGEAKQKFSQQERKLNGYCVYWNRHGCYHGDSCRFLHEEAPECKFQDNCFRKSTCKFYHHDQSFLDQGRRRTNQY